MRLDESNFFDIVDSAKLAVQYISEKSYEEFLADIKIQDAVIRRIEIIGEASNRISSEARNRFSHLPWKEMRGMRNLLIHEYDEIDLKEIWNTVKNDLPDLIKEIEKILSA
jgi:uncharacterized protein with HEPN domain